MWFSSFSVSFVKDDYGTMSEDSVLEAIQAISRKFDVIKEDVRMLKRNRNEALGLPN